jgi:glycosyltransferase involved in cell wall biosynthesis
MMVRSQPIDIIIITFQRLNFLKKTIDSIDKRTFYPFRIIVVDNASTDGTKEYLKEMKKVGKIGEHVFLPENIGQCLALNEGFKLVQSEYFVTTQDDCLPPDLRPCWLERLLHLYQKYEPDIGAICMRIQRTRRLEWSETDDVIINRKSMPSVFRMQRRDDMLKFGDRPFGKLIHWESHSFADTMRSLKKKFGMAVSLYADHFGFMSDNKGFEDGFTNYFTYSKERVRQGEEKPYPIIDSKSQIPLEILHPVDNEEHQKRLDYWGKETGVQNSMRKNSLQQSVLADLVKAHPGRWADLGCGKIKAEPTVIGIDTYPYECVDIVHDVTDLWFFKDGELDGIIASHLLEHLPDTKKALREWDRVIKIGGYMGFIVPDAERRPKTIREVSHKVALTKNIILQIMGRVLRYKIIRLGIMEEIPKPVLICIAQKR